MIIAILSPPFLCTCSMIITILSPPFFYTCSMIITILSPPFFCTCSMIITILSWPSMANTPYWKEMHMSKMKNERFSIYVDHNKIWLQQCQNHSDANLRQKIKFPFSVFLKFCFWHYTILTGILKTIAWTVNSAFAEFKWLNIKIEGVLRFR